uniref:class I SAM-dependent methyltransferase n=1 Tax=uncultured Altererythrobacter sp. TaxID=500840 RepID=UPI0026387F1F|nr:methyltransferase domain-containing protein [uncultured Altererythrobacter sp.]
MIKRILLTGLASAAMASATPVWADPADDAVAAETRTDEDRALDEGRQPAGVLRFAAPAEGDIVADFMSGGGYYAAMLADMVGPKGAIYAVNPAGFHNAEAWEARAAAHRNIRTMPVNPRQMMLAPRSVDMIFTHLVFHDLYWESERFQFPRLDEKAVLANWFAALEPGGHVIVVDHVGPAGDTRQVTADLHRIDPATVVSAMQAAGFVLVDQSDMLRRSDDDMTKNVFDESARGKTDRFMMKFQKPTE